MARRSLGFWGWLLLCFTIASTRADLEPRDSCDRLDSYLSSFSSYPRATVTSFCSSLLDYSNSHATTTRTITVKRTVSTRQTTTRRTITTTTTTRPTIRITEVSVITRKFTSTVTYGPDAKLRRDADIHPRAPPPLTVRNGKVLGKPVSVASKACSCIVKGPTSTVTTRTTLTSTITKLVTTIRTSTRTSTSYPITTVTRTTTRRLTYTVCAGTNPSPSFKLQFQDTGQTDQYNNQYLDYAPYPPEDGFEGDEILGSPTQAGGKVFYNDCIGRLTTAGSFGVLEYLAIIDGGDLSPVYLMNQTEYLNYEYAAYVYCDQSNGFLDCNAAGQTILQTTPLYELLGTIVVIGSRVGSGGQYYPFQWKVYPV